MSLPVSRRRALAGLSSLLTLTLAGCVQTRPEPPPATPRFPPAPAAPPAPEPDPVLMQEPRFNAEIIARYAAREDGGYQLPAIPIDKVDSKFLRQTVADPTGEAPGTIVVDTARKFLYLVLPGGMAMRYGVGLGRQGYSWRGRAIVQWKRPWPTWTPPDAMIKRDPKLEKWRRGMPPGIANPLGSRALYIFQNGQDTLYRIHGSPDWKSIGKSASAGCVRMFNQDVIDLFDRVKGKAVLVVI